GRVGPLRVAHLDERRHGQERRRDLWWVDRYRHLRTERGEQLDELLRAHAQLAPHLAAEVALELAAQLAPRLLGQRGQQTLAGLDRGGAVDRERGEQGGVALHPLRRLVGDRPGERSLEQAVGRTGEGEGD